MGIADRLSRVGHQMQEGVKSTILMTITWLTKLFSAFVLGLTFALIGLEAYHFGNIAFLTVLFLTMGLVLRGLKKWPLLNVLVFDLICVLVGLSLKMYIMLAP